MRNFLFRHSSGCLFRHRVAIGLCLLSLTATAHGRLPLPDGVPMDSVSEVALQWAARGDVAALRPLLATQGKELPAYVRTYCRLAVARGDQRWAQVAACVDTLVLEHAQRMDLKGRLGLSVMKAEALRRAGDYSSLATYCEEELRYYKRRSVKAVLLASFRRLAEKGRRLRGTDVRTRVLALADTHDAFSLVEHYGAALDSLDAYARLRGRLTGAVAFCRPQTALRSVDTLLTHYADSLDVEDKIYCLHAGGRAAQATGQWALLARWGALAEQWGLTEGLPYRHWQKMVQAFSALPATTVEAPDTAVIPLTWPTPSRVSLRLGHGAPQWYTVATGMAHTLITEREAREAGVTMADDTLDVVCSVGLVRACPAVAATAQLGDITFHHLPLYVVVDGHGLPEEAVRTVGQNEWARFSTLDIYPEKIVARRSPSETVTFPSAPTLCLSEEGELEARMTVEGTPRLLLCQLSYADNMLTPSALPADTVCRARLMLDWGTAREPVDMKRQEMVGSGDEGIIGYDFLRTGRRLRLDFERMTLEKDTTSAQVEMDYFFLQRNLPAYFRNSEQMAAVGLLPLAVAYCGDDAAAIVALTDSMAASLSPSHTLSSDEQHLLTERLKALIQQGEYGQAARLCERFSLVGDSLLALLTADRGRLLAALPPRCVPQGTAGVGTLSYLPGDDAAVAAVINGRESKAVLQLSLSPLFPVTMSQRMAKRLRLPTVDIDKKKKRKLALIDSLQLGPVRAYQVRCLVTAEGDDEGWRYGVGLLRLLPPTTFRHDGLAWGVADEASVAARLSTRDGCVVEGETPTGYTSVVVSSSAVPAAGKVKIVGREVATDGAAAPAVSLSSLLQAVETVTLDVAGGWLRPGKANP